MDHQPPRPTIIIDECLPRNQFRAFFASRGYPVLTVGEAFPSGSPDAAILAVAEIEAAIVVTNDKDWRSLVANVPGHKGRVRRAGRILLRCNHSVALRRVEELIEDIEREYAIAQASGRQLILHIAQDRFITER